MKGILSRKRRKIKLMKEKINIDNYYEKIEKVSRIISPSIKYEKIKFLSLLSIIKYEEKILRKINS